MNQKKAKKLRAKAKPLITEFIIARVLTPEQYQEATKEQLEAVIPDRLLLYKNRTAHQAFGTKRFFVRAVKKRPDITYQELDAAIYNS